MNQQTFISSIRALKALPLAQREEAIHFSGMLSDEKREEVMREMKTADEDLIESGKNMHAFSSAVDALHRQAKSFGREESEEKIRHDEIETFDQRFQTL